MNDLIMKEKEQQSKAGDEVKKVWSGGKLFFGTRKEDNAKIWFDVPEWQCGWYWGFGYLGNKNEHYHLDGYSKKDYHIKDENGKFHFIRGDRNENMFGCLINDYELAPAIKANLWQFCEIAKTIYTLKETAEVLGRGGSNFTTNLCKDEIVNKKEVHRINSVVIPKLLIKLREVMTACTLKDVVNEFCVKNAFESLWTDVKTCEVKESVVIKSSFNKNVKGFLSGVEMFLIVKGNKFARLKVKADTILKPNFEEIANEFNARISEEYNKHLANGTKVVEVSVLTGA